MRQHSFFNKTVEHCAGSASIKAGTIITGRVEMFQVLAASKEPPSFGGLDASCQAVYGPERNRKADSLKAWVKSTDDIDADLAYYDDHHPKYVDPSATAATYQGIAIVLSGPITSITNLKHGGVEYKQGLMQYVPFFINFGPPSTTPVPAGKPFIKPNSYKVGLG